MAVQPENIQTVSGLNRIIRRLLEESVGEVWVEGEISNHRRQASGHHYFSLKDETSQISCVLFRGNAGRVKSIENGMQVQIFGDLSVYEPRGQYQVVVRLLQEQGPGALQARFEALKQKLQAEGLFDPDRKQPLPAFPTRLAIVTSPTGAAVRDMINILSRRAPWLRIFIFPVKVQGTGAAEEIARAIRDLSEGPVRDLVCPDLVVVARGGGSLEDLWAFNEEVVARAMADCSLPTVSAVGHEIDFTISDFVADLRAPTPSAAAELVVPDRETLQKTLRSLAEILTNRVRDRLEHLRLRLGSETGARLGRETHRCLSDARQKTDLLFNEMQTCLEERMLTQRHRLQNLAATLASHRPDQVLALRREKLVRQAHDLQMAARAAWDASQHRLAQSKKSLHLLGPMETLKRGYSITTDEEGCLIESTNDAPAGTVLLTRLADGSLKSKTLPE